MKGILYSICVASLGFALTAQGQQIQGNASADVKAKARTPARAQATTSTKANATVTNGQMRPNARANVNANTSVSERTAMSTTRSGEKVAGTRSRQRANMRAQRTSSATTNRTRMRNSTANTRIRARTNAIANSRREQHVGMLRTREHANVSNRSNVHAMVNVNDRTRFRNVTRITSNGQTFDRAVFRDRDDWHLHLGFHDRAFFVNRFSNVVLINGCSYFLDGGIFWPAFIVGESCVPPADVVFVGVG